MSPYSIWYHRLCGASLALLVVAVGVLVEGAPLPVVGIFGSLALMCRAAASTVAWSGVRALLPTRCRTMSGEELHARVSADIAAMPREERDRLIDRFLPFELRKLEPHPAACPCWRCRGARGEEDTLRPFRARGRDPLTCAHLPADAMPLSGDGWICGVCGDDIPEPKGSDR